MFKEALASVQVEESVRLIRANIAPVRRSVDRRPKKASSGMARRTRLLASAQIRSYEVELSALIDGLRLFGIYWLKRAKNGHRELRGESVFRRED